MESNAIPINDTSTQINSLVDNIEKIIFGKREAVSLCVVGLLARGHILIEDVPGIGKTTLAQGLARSIDCNFNRIQFTNDMLPTDILGVSILNPHTQDFDYREGPIFANVVLADEINRTPPKTQSALLEAMSEFHVTVEGKTRLLPEPFMVLATQNPIEYEGTYILPEAQLDRFLLRVEIGYPLEDDELRVMRRHSPQKALADLVPVLTDTDVIALQEHSRNVKVEESVARYILGIVHGTRKSPLVRLGVSPRGSMALYETCQANALIQGRDYVTPGDVKAMALPVLAHRMLIKSQSGPLSGTSRDREIVLTEIIESVPVPM
ncbi:MAG: ATPase [Candidatus Hydrogenedentota bacterium]|nr:MAG: ATPase [Candidatus Hydrogenedentota bacterium]